MRIEYAATLLSDFREQAFGPGATPEDVATLQVDMKRTLPGDYVEYLVGLGCGFASSEDFLGLGGPTHLDVARVRRQLQEGLSVGALPDYLIPVRPDGYGNYDCVDLSRSTSERSTVVFWRHENMNELQVVGSGFWDWFCNQLESLREFDAEAG